MEEQLQEKRKELGLPPPKIFEGVRRESQKQSALRQLKSSRRDLGLHGGRKRTRRVPKKRTKRSRKTRKV